VENIYNGGTYYLQPHDSREATGIRALHVLVNGEKHYWIERRTAPKENPWLQVGALIHWVYPKNMITGVLDCDLLDMTPGSAKGAEDAALVIGRTFSDHEARIHITPTALIGDNNETIEIIITRFSTGLPISNLPPTISISAPHEPAKLNKPVTITVRASDPNRHKMAYYWDFGNGEWMGGTKCTTVTPIFAEAGTYKVQCTVTDMNGGTATASIDVTVPGK
jgi:hypothetical protein